MSDVDRCLWAEIDKLESCVVITGGASTGVYADADVFAWLMDGEVINLGIFAVVFFRLHHEAAPSQLAEHTSFPAFGIKDPHFRFSPYIASFTSPLPAYSLAAYVFFP